MNEESIENNLVFYIDPWKAFATKSISRFVFRNLSHKIKIRLFSISVKFWFRFLYKTMMKQTVSEQFSKKEWFSIVISEAVCLLNSPLLERSDDLSNYTKRVVTYCFFIHKIIFNQLNQEVDWSFHRKNKKYQLRADCADCAGCPESILFADLVTLSPHYTELVSSIAHG